MPAMSASLVIRSLLFADVSGFSRLSENAYAEFLEHFLEMTRSILDEQGHLVANTWGDAIFAVFDTTTAAGRAALDLQACILAEPRFAALQTADGSTRALRLRIALHAGPVREVSDAVTGRRNFVGRHTNLAARLEPIAEEGQIYVTGDFAALSTVENAGAFDFRYVGRRTLPKNAGCIPVYHLTAAP
jgi:class 3 adenylate cyclase